MPFSKLQAVNRVLRAGGGQQVNSLTAGSDAANLATSALEDNIKSLQTQTQWFNTVRTTLLPTVDNKIPLGLNVIAVDGRARVDSDGLQTTTASTTNNGINVGAAGGQSSDAVENANVAQRGGFLFDLDNNTDLFTRSVYVWLTEELSYDDCPAHVQEYAITQAAREYQMEHMGDNVADGRLAQKEEQARQEYNRMETLQADANHFTRLRNTTLLTVGGRGTRYAPNSVIPGAPQY